MGTATEADKVHWRETTSSDWQQLRLFGEGLLVIQEKGSMAHPRWSIKLNGMVLGWTKDRSPASRRAKAVEMAREWIDQSRRILEVAVEAPVHHH